jgi:homotetrameric cytidine deaminase
VNEGPGGAQLDTLIAEAASARDLAYAPYSGYPVGAAVLVGGGRVFRGSNVENASFPVGICAERVAAAAAVTAGARDLEVIAVSGPAELPSPPCGQCRQFLFEFNPEMVVVAQGSGGDRIVWRLSQLLPDPFVRKGSEDR